MFKTRIFAPILLGVVSLACQTQQYSTGLQQSVERADETAATAALRTIAVAQRAYSVSSGGGFGTFQQLCDAGDLDARFNSSKPTVKDYVLTMEVSQGFFSCNADPVGPKAGRHFYIDSTSSELHVNPNETATARDPVAAP